jgi:hypothetical protein
MKLGRRLSIQTRLFVRNTSRWIRKRPLLVLTLTLGIVTVFGIVALFYNMLGSGFGAKIIKGEIFPAKTLWDWLDLLIVPLILAIAGITINSTIQHSEREQAQKRAEVDRQIAEDRVREQALQTYLGRMSDLLLHEKLSELDGGEKARTIARALTLTVLLGLDGKRKGLVLRFIYENKLIGGGEAIIDLSTADFTHAELQSAYLVKAHLRQANLKGADLSEAELRDAKLIQANLTDANLTRASLRSADVSGANLGNAKLNKANLSRTDFSGAVVTQEQLESGILYETTKLPQGSFYQPLAASNAAQTLTDNSATQQKSS